MALADTHLPQQNAERTTLAASQASVTSQQTNPPSWLLHAVAAYIVSGPDFYCAPSQLNTSSPRGVFFGSPVWSTLVLKSNEQKTERVFLLSQPNVTPSPPPVSQLAPSGNHSPHLPAQQPPTAPPEPARKSGQNFKCLWQSCKR